jgi:hypothetical protein
MRTKPSALACLLALAVVRAAHGVDASKLATSVETFEHWQVVHFALPTSFVYRLATTSVNTPDVTITVDLSDKCLPRGVVMNWTLGSESMFSGSGAPLLLAYKIPREKEDFELVMSQGSPDDAFRSFPLGG